MDTLLDFTLKQCLESKDASALLAPVSPGNQPSLDLNAAMQLLKPRSANTFPELSFNDPTLLLLNSLLSNQLNPFTQTLLSNTTAANQNQEAPPTKRQCLESSLVPAIQPISPSHTASTSSCGSAISPQQCPSPWPTSIGGLSPKKAKRKPPAPIPDEKKDSAYYERRKKNNDAAKRSRDARRMKEEQTASRAANLEHENAKLQKEVTYLKSEISKMRLLMLANPASNGIVKPQPLSIAHNEPSSSSD